MNRMIWLMQQKLERIGWHGVFGIALLIFSAAFCATAVPARMAELDALQQELGVLRTRSSLSGAGAGKSTPSSEERLGSFYAFFPEMVTLPDWLERIYAAAAESGVALETGEYRLVEERNVKLARYQLTLPIKGGYTQVRQFVARVLNEVPAAGLDEVAFKRDSIGSATLDARVRLTIYLGRNP